LGAIFSSLVAPTPAPTAGEPILFQPSIRLLTFYLSVDSAPFINPEKAA
jgi:hypothetical protein